MCVAGLGDCWMHIRLAIGGEGGGNICYGNSLEAPQRGASDEYLQHNYVFVEKRKIFIGYPPLFRPMISTVIL